MIGYCILASIGCLIYWAITNSWSDNDCQNFSQAARHGTRMRR